MPGDVEVPGTKSERLRQIHESRISSTSKRNISRIDLPLRGPNILEKMIHDAFDVFDNARNHEVDVRELGTIIRSLGCVISEAELQEIQVEVEDVENNCVPQSRFVEYMCKIIGEHKLKPAEPEELLKAFQLLDPENHGYIMRDDFAKAMMELGEPYSQEEVDEMMTVACDPVTNRINYEHYINLLIVKLPLHSNVHAVATALEVDRVAAMPKKDKLTAMLSK